MRAEMRADGPDGHLIPFDELLGHDRLVIIADEPSIDGDRLLRRPGEAISPNPLARTLEGRLEDQDAGLAPEALREQDVGFQEEVLEQGFAGRGRGGKLPAFRDD